MFWLSVMDVLPGIPETDYRWHPCGLIQHVRSTAE
jgi:hypothetical protein